MTTSSAPPDLLAAIVAATRRIVQVRSQAVPMAELERRVTDVEKRTGRFREALAAPDRINVIAECKRRSPSRGVLRERYDAGAIAGEYEGAGAAAVSVLTEPTFFDGSMDDLAAVRKTVSIPILRKDFIVDPYQILEAQSAGADAILLIVAALERHQLRSLQTAGNAAGLDVLVEVHDEHELQQAVDAGASIIGVNNRNLRTLDVDIAASERIMARFPKGVVAVAESGLRNAVELQGLRAGGYDAFLIGESFMTKPSPGDALRQLLLECNGCL